ncbi:Sec-independent protein translocase protein TatB [Sphingomonas baiyangensis]|uniref:Twin-arginine translocase subunit TatB n=1 Tax=Sphingomonas baiyangensis TaxID=2572576 RepID=A0A4V5PWE8_9SPHN|nr:Sec-independent protein translocase protein TatB [Sphingomonas baiyangensis]TKD51378.1 twin-arginine translocase subunit TatB [Sphingomonas baiyangensis]
MLDFNMTEMLVVAVVALLVIGPKDLPRAMRMVGQWVGKARGVARQFRSGFDAMVREAELSEMETKWAEENARIMREHPPEPAATALPAPHTSADDGEPATSNGPSAEVSQPEIRSDASAPAMPPAGAADRKDVP